MPRGRHRHSPPLHRLLPPSVIAGVSVVCASSAWFFSDTAILRGLAAGAGAAAVVGSVVMRRWDLVAGRRVAELLRARAGDEWRFEERVAEVESDLEESRAARGKLELKLRAKRTELAALRGEHAALLRRYATAETERASALEGRRRLAIEAAVPGTAGAAAPVPADDDAEPSRVEPAAPVATGALYLRANSALDRLGRGKEAVGGRALPAGPPAEASDGASEGASDGASAGTATAGPVEASAPKAPDAPAPRDGSGPGSARDSSGTRAAPRPRSGPRPATAPTGGRATVVPGNRSVPRQGGSESPAPKAAGRATPDGAHPAKEGEGRGKAPAADGYARTVAAADSAGHFNVPTAAAVVPPAPARRRPAPGGFDFFGAKGEPEAAALEAVQNEDLADVVGEEALALHKAESEAGFKRSGAAVTGVGQVVDLTAHDETEPIDIQGLRSALQA
ncbi:hypothetical protein [Streptomyces uncialis]|uniref:hypothetical protein n=1 Tax=Streptomyces uncialis TaxID=1048205 RepID=UPI00224DA089|nr:hypothetical protein [Streptomyces uncialis]MCX4664642.1 hypothetical protein [Streptomyces uncialis]